jgi:hypothetical protein
MNSYITPVTNQQTDTFRAAFREAREAFHAKSSRLNTIEMEASTLKDEIRQLRRTITALAPLCSGNPRVDKLGITDICTEVMEIIPSVASTSEVVQWIEMYGFDISMQKNAEASVHAVLTRLAKDEKVEKITDETGAVTWKGPGFVKDEDIPF